MPALQPIAWTEGAFLTQQHFQYWDRWHANQQKLAIEASIPDPYGLVACEFDEDAFRQQKCVIKKLVLRKNSGQWLTYDHLAMPPLAVSLGNESSQTIYLTQPKNNLCSGLAGYEKVSDHASFVAKFIDTPDQFDPVRFQEVAVALPKLTLTLKTLDSDLYDQWPLAKIKKIGGTDFELDQSFVPVCMMVKGCPQLAAKLNAILRALSAKMTRLKKTHSLGAYSHVYETFFSLRDMLSHGCGSPRDTYNLLARLCVNLAMMSDEVIEIDLYQHSQMGQQLLEVMGTTLEYLQQEVETLPSYDLSINDKHMHYLNNINPDHLQGYEWYLGIDFLGENPDALQKFKSQAKIGTLDTLDQIIASALPGIAITHTLRPSKQIAIKDGYEYFKLSQDSLYWKNLKEELSLMMYLPSLKQGTQITIDVVKE